MDLTKLTKGDQKKLSTYKSAMRSMWEQAAKFAGRDPRPEVKAFDAGWDSVFAAMKFLGARKS